MKSLIAHACPVLVLAAGLISCTKQNESILRIPEPNWETSQGVQKFTTVNQLTADHKVQSRTISDRLSFVGPSAQLRVTSSCRTESSTSSNEQIYYEQQVMFTLPGKISLFSMMPTAALNPAVLAKSLYCSFHFQAMNGEGAKHTFHTNEIRVQDSSTNEGIEAISVIAKHEESYFGKSEFRLRTTQALDTKLICDLAEGEAHHIDNKNLLLSEFELPKNEKFRQHPSETCRIIGIEKGVTTMMSTPFSVQFNSAGPTFETHAISYNGKSATAQIVAYNFQIRNSTQQTLRFQVPKLTPEDFAGAANMYGRADNYCRVGSLSKADVKYAVMRFDVPQSTGVLIAEKTTTEIVLPSQTTVSGQIDIGFYQAGSSYVPGQPIFSTPNGYIVQLAKPIQVNVFTDDSAKETYPVVWNFNEMAIIGIAPQNIPKLPCAY